MKNELKVSITIPVYSTIILLKLIIPERMEWINWFLALTWPAILGIGILGIALIVIGITEALKK